MSQILSNSQRYNQNYDKEYENVVTVAAGAAANATTYHYVDMRFFRKMGAQLEWTPGAVPGTIVVTLEGSVQHADSATAAASIEYDDITTATFGAASYTDDFLLRDNAEKLAMQSWVRFKIIVANKDAATAYRLDVSKIA